MFFCDVQPVRSFCSHSSAKAFVGEPGPRRKKETGSEQHNRVSHFAPHQGLTVTFLFPVGTPCVENHVTFSFTMSHWSV